MSASRPPVFLPEPWLQYRCNLQGCCCGGWRIPLRDEDLARVQAARPDLSAAELAVRLPRAPELSEDGQREGLYMRQDPDPDGRPRCRFLVADGRCALHAAGGVAVLPGVCVQFPSRAFYVAGRLELRFRLLCPSVLEPLFACADPVAAACVLGELPQIDLARRCEEARPVEEVLLGTRNLTPEQALALRHHALGALNERDRPASEVLAGLGAGLAAVERSGDVAGFQPRAPYDEAAFVQTLFGAAERLRPEQVVGEFVAYGPFVAPALRPLYPSERALFEGLEEWPRHLLELVLPVEEQLRPYLLRCLWARYQAVFFADHGPHRFDHAAVLDLYALAVRLLSSLAGVRGQAPDLDLLQIAFGLAAFCEHNRHQGDARGVTSVS